jgi:hypothetical protein
MAEGTRVATDFWGDSFDILGHSILAVALLTPS